MMNEKVKVIEEEIVPDQFKHFSQSDFDLRYITQGLGIVRNLGGGIVPPDIQKAKASISSIQEDARKASRARGKAKKSGKKISGS
jgi:hypothetical protein